MDVELERGADVDRAPDEERAEEEAEGEEDEARVEVEPAGREDEEEAEMTPAVAPGAKVGWAGTAVFSECCGDFGDAEIGEAGLDHHLGGELHAGGAQVQILDFLAMETAQAAVKIVDGRR